jgi:catechol 2,3-dioxygenase-like lactoylglutathione lyase family enzyme
MVGLVVEDMATSLRFYRRLGMDIPEGSEKEPFVRKQMESGADVFWDTAFAPRHDPDGERPAKGYRVMLEFTLADEGEVDAKYEEMVRHGYHGRLKPAQTVGSYAAMVDDPEDGTVVVLAAG